MEALSRHPWQSSCFHEVQEAWKHPTSTIQVSFVQTFYCDLFFGKPTPEEAFYNTQVVCAFIHVKILDWRSRTVRRTKKHHERPQKTYCSIEERSTPRGCRIGRQRIQVLWRTDQRSYRPLRIGFMLWRMSGAAISRGHQCVCWTSLLRRCLTAAPVLTMLLKSWCAGCWTERSRLASCPKISDFLGVCPWDPVAPQCL